MQTAAAAPVGLLDPSGHQQATAAVAAAVHAEWRNAVAGTSPARPWRHFVDRHLADPDRHRLEQAWAAFTGQPGIAAMLAAEQAGTAWFVTDQYGPGLCAHQNGLRRVAGYIADTMELGDALLDPHARLWPVTDPPRPPVEHTLAERDTYHAAARQLLARLDPDTVVATIHIDL